MSGGERGGEARRAEPIDLRSGRKFPRCCTSVSSPSADSAFVRILTAGKQLSPVPGFTERDRDPLTARPDNNNDDDDDDDNDDDDDDDDDERPTDVSHGG